MTIPVHVISGFLGAGKTTLLLDQLRQRQQWERCAVLVNDFGEARIDAQLLGGTVAVTEVAGGCVCCTAPEGMVAALGALLDERAPDRVFIEATGLARPEDIVDTLRRSPLADRLSVAPVVVVIDPARLLGRTPPLLLEQLDAADVVVVNRAREANAEALAAWRGFAAERFPPLLAFELADHGVVSPSLFDVRATDAHHHHHDHDHSQHASTEGYAAASRTWGPDKVFDSLRLRALIAGADAERIKGLFRTDLGWFRMERASGAAQVVSTGLRSGSAVDVIVEGEPAEAEALLALLDAAEAVEPEASEEPQVSLEAADGSRAELSRWALGALPGQVHDVSTVVPGREGRGVLLSEVLALGGPATHFVLVAADGMTTAPARVDAVGDAVVVHALDQQAYPDGLGGPFRVLTPPGGGSACKSVKQLVRIVLSEDV